MHLWEVIVISIGLSLEAFTQAIMKGANQKQLPASMFFFMSLFFGAIETVMLMIGMGIGIFPMCYMHSETAQLINKWFSAIILLFLGFKAFKRTKMEIGFKEHLEEKLKLKEVTLLAVGTGFDALLLGVVLALLNTSILGIYAIFGFTSLFVGLGLWVGGRMGSSYKVLIDSLSGIILVTMGIKVIIEFFEMI